VWTNRKRREAGAVGNIRHPIGRVVFMAEQGNKKGKFFPLYCFGVFFCSRGSSACFYSNPRSICELFNKVNIHVLKKRLSFILLSFNKQQ